MYWKELDYKQKTVELTINGYKITAGPTNEEFQRTSGYDDEYRIYVLSKEMTDPYDGHKYHNWVWKGYEFKDLFYEDFYKIVQYLQIDPMFADVKKFVNPYCVY